MNAIIEFFNVKKHPNHLWLFASLGSYLIMLIYVFIDDGLGYKLGLSRTDKNAFMLICGPISLIGISLFTYTFIQKHRDYFQSSFLSKLGFYFFLIVTAGNAIWMLIEVIGTWKCRGFLCDLGILFPFFAIPLTTALILLYSLIIFIFVKKRSQRL